MLAWILLEHHNTHHMQRFMAAVRRSIRQGSFRRLKASLQTARLKAYDSAA